MTIKVDENFKGKLTCGLKNNIRHFGKLSKNLHFDQNLLSKAFKI